MVIYGVIAIAVTGYVGHCEYVKKDRTQFIAKLEAQAEAQKLENKRKETENAKRIQDALGERDAALKRLRNKPRPVSLSDPTAPASVGSRFSIETSAYNAAMGEFRKSLGAGLAEAQRLATEGDEAAIDAKALLQSWPR